MKITFMHWKSNEVVTIDNIESFTPIGYPDQHGAMVTAWALRRYTSCFTKEETELPIVESINDNEPARHVMFVSAKKWDLLVGDTKEEIKA